MAYLTRGQILARLGQEKYDSRESTKSKSREEPATVQHLKIKLKELPVQKNGTKQVTELLVHENATEKVTELSVQENATEKVTELSVQENAMEQASELPVQRYITAENNTPKRTYYNAQNEEEDCSVIPEMVVNELAIELLEMLRTNTSDDVTKITEELFDTDTGPDQNTSEIFDTDIESNKNTSARDVVLSLEEDSDAMPGRMNSESDISTIIVNENGETLGNNGPLHVVDINQNAIILEGVNVVSNNVEQNMHHIYEANERFENCMPDSNEVVMKPNVNFECNKTLENKGQDQSHTWKRNSNKQNRMLGKAYKGVKKQRVGDKILYKQTAHKCERALGAMCRGKCRKKCTLLTQKNRQTIFDAFWNMNWQQKQIYLTNLVDCDHHNYARAVKHYHLKISDSERIPVCKEMFMNTFNIREKQLRNWVSNSAGLKGMYPKPERQPQKNNKSSKKKHESAEMFLDSLNYIDSHYCRKNSNKKYVDSQIKNMAKLLHLYKVFCKTNALLAGSKKLLISVFKQKNLSLYKPKKDRCDLCEEYKLNSVEQEIYDVHIEKKKEAYLEKETDKIKCKESDEVEAIVVDTQQIMLCPLLENNSQYYKSKLCNHNYTIYRLSDADVLSVLCLARS